MISERQKHYMNSPHTHPYLKECMRLSLSIRELEGNKFDKLPLDEKIANLIEGELEFIDILKQKGYTENTKVLGYFPIKQSLIMIKLLTELLKKHEAKNPGLQEIK